ncbi:bifunctional glutamate N-acetyltransferase/amino-acid acetyltransferase ArgJ [Amylibacter sp. IMCC11727]|uniref:bifunctional glutamate N-acetyltransferase/amino-acid acetyltransferase ArgJ n=1 Tax=Amylibacter sp. IMCC11727 TaxID=3039851 RepID=UPI00244DA622|nr:bifunctional glutamate N-acetyltransferase/amino-acid acetyltransferase ArgJ [Amylibacter sp. IMCC11727]WGI22021.1 bifunctional glutamate N-acetyltransferase/amino-acid acetyltransferase ArgJ [Amylibacter sp. IMCC11727]
MAKSKAKLKSKIKKLKQKIKRLRADLHTASSTPAISPLAPPSGFPALPEIGGVTYAAGAAGVKYQDRDDVMLAHVAAGSAVAGVFTRSATRSGPVLDCQAKLANLQKTDTVSGALGVVVNSGNSNAFTGKAGDESVGFVSASAAKSLKTKPENILTSSTGVIGEPLPHDKIIAVLDDLAANQSPTNGQAAAAAIMTTDTFAKGSAKTININDKPINIAGFAKGSGMIAPDMATMLVYIFTDAAVTSPALQQMISAENQRTFNAITVDSDTSTSDTLLAFATGAAGNDMISDATSDDGQTLAAALHDVMRDLAHLVVKDGEGATKFIEVAVTGATSDESAQTVALAIANSPLVKTAAAGEDPNWGRVVMAVGKSGEPADRDKISIHFGDILVAENGWVSPNYTEAAGVAYMKNQDLKISTDLGIGNGSAQVWTCDLTHGYITINADYRS